MLITQFDIKTGKVLQQPNPETLQLEPKQKLVEHSYLEAWLKQHKLANAAFFVGEFYPGVDENDRLRLEKDGKVLVFTNGKKGYFTDLDTARLMIQGDRTIQPIYAGDGDAAHNAIAYGSLIASDGIASTMRGTCKILVIDDEAGLNTDFLSLDDRLLNKMGDGTMLVSEAVVRSLMTPEDEALNPLTLVTQFRAASPDFPGIAKGTLTYSKWCEDLGVEAIVSRSDIKGDDGRFSRVGIHEVESFWINRKADAQYGFQSVGPQVKGCIPEATLHEFNPRMKEKAEKLAAIASDPVALMQYYAQKKVDREEIEEESPGRVPKDWLKELAVADPHGMLAGFKRVNSELERFLKGEWKDLALRGIEVPSATAQNHGSLKPWEIANRDLPQGAIVAYYRSPFPNVGAAAIGINNIRSLRWEDTEAYDKAGVIFLNPWTVKNIAITDFDGDRNGCFVGFTAVDGTTLPDLMRSQLVWTEELPEEKQYEAARSLIQQLIKAQELVKPADYPQALTEFVERNAPDRKPPEIVKAVKVKHEWDSDRESHSAATWRAWERTAQNPTGMVANVGMTLQSLAMETVYISDDRKEGLLEEISAHHRKILARVQAGKLVIPSGILKYNVKERIETIASSSQDLKTVNERAGFVDDRLNLVNELLNDMVNGPNAMNLQTAVDTAKSSQGIDFEVQALMQALAHRKHLLRANQRNPEVYTHGQGLPTNTQEPIGWAVETVNQIYVESTLPELKHEVFRDLFPKDNFSVEIQNRAMTIARAYQGMVKEARVMDDRLRQRKLEDQQPTVRITTLKGTVLTIQRMLDVEQGDEIWRSDGLQKDWVLEIERDAKSPEGLTVAIVTPRGKQAIGFVCPESIAEYRLDQRVEISSLRIASPTIELLPPLRIQHDLDDRIREAKNYLEGAIGQIPEEERMAYASALWHHSDGMGIVLKGFMPEVTQQLQNLPNIKLTGLQQDVNQVGTIAEGSYEVLFTIHRYEKNGEWRSVPAIAVLDEAGVAKTLGSIDPRTLRFPEGTIARADILAGEKVAQVQVTEILRVQKNQGYSPSRSELRDWYLAVKELGEDEALGRIEGIGRRLNEAYCDELGAARAAIGMPAVTQTPMEFRSDRVTLTTAELGAMRSVRQGKDLTGDRALRNQAEMTI
jgi:hypothetical protein